MPWEPSCMRNPWKPFSPFLPSSVVQLIRPMALDRGSEEASGDRSTEEVEKDSSPLSSAKDAVYAMLGSQLRTTLSDGRVVEGKLQCMDRLTNFILADAVETTKLPAVSGEDGPIKAEQGSGIGASDKLEETGGVQQRHLGLVMIPGKHLVSVQRRLRRYMVSAHHMIQPGTQGISIVEEATTRMTLQQQLSASRRLLLLPWCGGGATATSATLAMTAVAGASAVTMVVTLSMMMLWWWRSAEVTRVRKIVRQSASPQVLPTPVPALPRWLGFFGGHTLLVKPPKMTQQVEDWAKEFGGDYEINIFGRSVVVLTSVSGIRQVLNLRPSKFRRGFASSRMVWAGRQAEVVPSMFFDEGKEWGRSRRLISPNIAGHNVRAMISYISKIGERLCDKLSEHADSDEAVDSEQYFARFTHDIIALTAFGIDVDSTRATEDRPCPSFHAIESTLRTLALVFDTIKSLQWKYFSTVVPWVRRIKESSRQLGIIVQGAIDATRSEGGGEDSGTGDEQVFAGTLLRKIVKGADSCEISNRMKFSREEVLYQVKGLFVAGTDTTSVALSWVMYYLVKNPAAFARCRAEALKVAPSSGGMVSTSEELSQLTFCAAVFREVARLKTAGPVLTHTCLEDHTLKSGYKIEKGKAVMVLTRFASISEDNFTRGAEFVPERWIESERAEALLGRGAGDDEKRNIRHSTDAYLAFGSGPRMCPGQDLAKAEAVMIIAAICTRFDVSLAPGQADPPEEISHFTVGPKAIQLSFKRRPGIVTCTKMEN